jgi:hypothetical protein
MKLLPWWGFLVPVLLQPISLSVELQNYMLEKQETGK